MEITFILQSIAQSFAISLGVGSSTVAIVNFMVAIRDGTIDTSERTLMGIAYTLLRIAMIVLLVTVTGSLIATILTNGVAAVPMFMWAQLTIVEVLFFNAILMTRRLMPSTLGPALQAGSWYTLGTLAALAALGLTGFTYVQFFLAYIAIMAAAVGIVNSCMAYQKSHPQSAQK